MGLVPTFCFGLINAMDQGRVNETVSSIAKEIAGQIGVEFVRTEFAGTKRNPVIRIYVDREEGLSVEHCADVSRAVEERLDAIDIIPGSYVLEVSSPGLERELFTIEEFQRFSGRLVKIKTDREIDGASHFAGRIVKAEGGSVELDTGRSGKIEIPFANISKAKLKLDLQAELKSGGKG